jgi:threonine dehydratase
LAPEAASTSRPAPPSAYDIRRAAAAGAGVIRETPLLSSRTLAERTGITVALKAENLQRTGSFKIRGALAKIASLGDACEGGVVCASAGNHAQAVAYAARERGVSCDVFMPESAPIAKAEATMALGARVRLMGESVDESLAAAREYAHAGCHAFVHPFDDPEVVAGQGTLGLELLAQVPDLARVVVPTAAAAPSAGVAIAVKSQRPGGGGDRRPGGGVRPVSGVASGRRADRGGLGADHRRRDRRQASRGADAGAHPPVG